MKTTTTKKGSQVMTDQLQEPTFAPGHGPDNAMVKAGDDQPQPDYFGFSRGEKFYMPGSDKKFWIECQALNEGAKKSYQDKTSRDLVVERTGSTRMSILQGSERHELLRSAMTGWNLLRNGAPVPFDRVNVNDFLMLADPRIVEDLEKFIRKLNPWLMADMKSEDIRKEIENLEEMLREAEKREAGEDS